ncbi:MAG: hypothetical protein ACTTHM_05150 [Peptoanaerobacter stomatis]|uniref:hypothetical protein n=1 Tax=Peptoanaerobacter stomatis TaxID=796937 RepID=UPI003F9F3E24
MGGRLIFITMLSFLGIIFFAIVFRMYIYMKRTVSDGKSLMEKAVNEQTNTEKMGISEFLIYAVAIFGALSFAFKLIKQGGSGFSLLAKSIVLPPLMALFNARKRNGRTLFVCTVITIFSFYLFMIYIFIDIPPKAPVFTINNTEITLSHTTVASLLSDGFDIYIRQNDAHRTDYEKLLYSDDFEKYTANRSILVEKGFRRNNESVPYSMYILAKGGVVIGTIGLYGHETKDIVLEDCKIIHFKLDENCVASARENLIIYSLNDIKLLAPLKLEELQKTFDKKLWLVPPTAPIDITQLHYGIKWSTRSDHLFWNEYFAYINFDENNNMTKFELSTEVARDWKK